MLRELTVLGSAVAGKENGLEPLTRLAAELVLASSAAQAGMRTHIIGRSHGMCVTS